MLISRLSEQEKSLIGLKIREGLEVKGLTQDYLAAVLNVDPRTVRNILCGKSLTVPRLNAISEALGIEFETPTSETNNTGLDFGGYPKHSVEKYIGNYVAVRHSLGSNPNLHCSFYSFDWDNDKGALHFNEENKFIGSNDRLRDFSQGGSIYISPDIGLLHLMTSWRGAVRLITLSKLRMNSNMMYGAVLTQSDQRFGFMPALSPVAFKKIESDDERHVPERSGPIKYQTETHDFWSEYLQTAETEYICIQSQASNAKIDGDVVKLSNLRN